MKAVPGFMLVRSRWVVAKEGDSKEPVFHARRVRCKVKKGGEKVDDLYATTPLLDVTHIMFFQFSSGANPEGKFRGHPQELFQWSADTELVDASIQKVGTCIHLVGRLV